MKEAKVTISATLEAETIRTALADWASKNIEAFKGADKIEVDLVATQYTTGYGWAECDKTRIEARLTARP